MRRYVKRWAVVPFKPRVTGELNWNYAVIICILLLQAVTLIRSTWRRLCCNVIRLPIWSWSRVMVTVFGREDLRQPVDSNDRFVRLEGECMRLACIACYLVRQPDNWSRSGRG